jgi:hypothetical protein
MTFITPKSTRQQRGIAAVELALLLPIFLALLSLPLYFGRVFWHYTVVQNAAQDAARYLSSVPQIEIKDPSQIGAVVAVAGAIIAAETAQLNPGTYAPTVAILCNGGVCGGFSIPLTVTVHIELLMEDVFFPNATGLSVPIAADAAYPYVGH